MRFSEWLLTQSDRDDPVGDLAEDVRRDPPVGAWDSVDLRRHMLGRGACQEAVEALNEAVFEWHKCCGSPTGDDRIGS